MKDYNGSPCSGNFESTAQDPVSDTLAEATRDAFLTALMALGEVTAPETPLADTVADMEIPADTQAGEQIQLDQPTPSPEI